MAKDRFVQIDRTAANILADDILNGRNGEISQENANFWKL